MTGSEMRLVIPAVAMRWIAVVVKMQADRQSFVGELRGDPS